MSTPISSDNPYAAIGLKEPPKASAKTNELGQEDFLKLMTTQLMHQDPFQPMESGEFLAQMAQFSTVSGIQELQKTAQSLVGSLQGDRLLQASSLVGKKVMIASSEAELEGSLAADGKPGPGMLTGAVDVPEGGSSITVSIQSAEGEILHTQDLTPSSSGLVDFVWDGKLADGGYAPPGKYKVVAQGNVAGKSEALAVHAAASVNSISLDQQSVILHTAQGSITLDQVSRILA